VAASTFDVPRDAELWFAQHNQDSIGHAFDAFVRFKPGRTPESLSAAMPAMWNGLANKYPDQQVSAGNWAVLAGSSAIVLLVSLAARVPSARRAATKQPARVLRS
jgi:hypothetical protein